MRGGQSSLHAASWSAVPPPMSPSDKLPAMALAPVITVIIDLRGTVRCVVPKLAGLYERTPPGRAQRLITSHFEEPAQPYVSRMSGSRMSDYTSVPQNIRHAAAETIVHKRRVSSKYEASLLGSRVWSTATDSRMGAFGHRSCSTE